MPKVSIIIPVYNVEHYLREALDSVVNQTLSDIEIICIDDCSTDGSYRILEEYAKTDSRFVVLKQEYNQGQGVARNRGINIAKSPYIMFLDPDDWFELDACERAYNQISKNNDDVVFFNSQTCDEDGNLISVDKKLKPYKKYLDGRSFSLKKIKKNFIKGKIACWSRIYNTEFMRKHDIYFPEVRRSEDVEFSIKIYLEAEKVSVANFTLLNYRKCSYSPDKHRLASENVYDALKRSFELVMKKQDNKYILKHFLVYAIKLCVTRYFGIKTDKLNYNANVYQKAREFLKFIDNRHDVSMFCDEFDIVAYRLFILCPNSLIFDFVYPLLSANYTIDDKHIIFNLGKIKIKIRIKNKKYLKKGRV